MIQKKQQNSKKDGQKLSLGLGFNLVDFLLPAASVPSLNYDDKPRKSVMYIKGP